MEESELIKQFAETAREWRDRVLEKMKEDGLTDLSHRPTTAMSALGWILVHQAAIYDYGLHTLILDHPPYKPELLKDHVPGTSGDWQGTTWEEIHEYYDSIERAFIMWSSNIATPDLDRVIDREDVPKFFRGMTVRKIVANMFAHINFHTGHLEALRRDWLTQMKPEE